MSFERGVDHRHEVGALGGVLLLWFDFSTEHRADLQLQPEGRIPSQHSLLCWFSMAAFGLPQQLPSLPDVVLQRANMHAASQLLAGIYARGIKVLAQDGPDPLQISCLTDNISSDAVPILQAMEEENQAYEIPLQELADWLDWCGGLFGDMIMHLRNAKGYAAGK
jgi:hypothetical protein